MPEKKKPSAEEVKKSPKKKPQQSNSIDFLQKSFKDEIKNFMGHKEARVTALGAKNSKDFLSKMHDYMRGDKEKKWLLLKMKTAINHKDPESVTMDQIIKEFGDIEVSANLALKDYVDIYVESIQQEEPQKVVYIKRHQKLMSQIPKDQHKKLYKAFPYLGKNNIEHFGKDSRAGQIQRNGSYLTWLLPNILDWLTKESSLNMKEKQKIHKNLLSIGIKVSDLDILIKNHYNNNANVKKNLKKTTRSQIKDILVDQDYIRKIYPTFVANSVALGVTKTVEDGLAMNKEYDRDMLDAVTGNTMYTLLSKKFPISDFRKGLRKWQVETMFGPENKKKKLRETAYIYYVIWKTKASSNSSDTWLRTYLQELLDHKLSTAWLSTTAKDGLLQRQISQQAPHMQQAYMSKVMGRYIWEQSNEKITEWEVKRMNTIYSTTRKQLYRMDQPSSDVDVAWRSGVKLRFSGRDMKFGRQNIVDIATIGTDFSFGWDIELIFPEDIDQTKKAEVQAAFAAAFGLDQWVYKTRIKQAQLVDPYGQMVPSGSNTLCSSLNHFLLFSQLRQVGKIDPEAVQDVFGRTPEEKRESNRRQMQDLFHTWKNKTEAEILASTAKNLGIKQKDISREFLRSSFVSFDDFYQEHAAVYRQDEDQNKKDLDGLYYLSQRHKSSADGLPAWNWKGQVYMNRAYFQSKYGIDYDQHKREVSFGSWESKRTLTKTARNVLWLSVSRYFNDHRSGWLPELDQKDKERLTTDVYDITNLDNDLRALLWVRAELEKLKNHEDMHTFLQLHGFEYQDKIESERTIYTELSDTQIKEDMYMSIGNAWDQISVHDYIYTYMWVSTDVLMIEDEKGKPLWLTHELLCMIAEWKMDATDGISRTFESTSLAPYQIIAHDGEYVTLRTRQPGRQDLDGLTLPYIEHRVRLSDLESHIQELIIGQKSEENNEAEDFSFARVSNINTQTLANGKNLSTWDQLDGVLLDELRAARGNNVHGTGDGLDSTSAQNSSVQYIATRFFDYSVPWRTPPSNPTNRNHYAQSLKDIFDNGDFDAFETRADAIYDSLHQQMWRLWLTVWPYGQDRTWANRHIAKSKYIYDNWTTWRNFSTDATYNRYASYIWDPLSWNLDGFIVNTRLGREWLQNIWNLNLSPVDRAQIDTIMFDNNGAIRAVDDLSSLELAQAWAILRSATVVPPANASNATQNNNQNQNSTNTNAASNNPNTTNNVNDSLSSFGHFEIAKRGEWAFDTDPDKADTFVKKNPTDRYIIDTWASMFSYIWKPSETYPNPILDVSSLWTTPTKDQIDAFVKTAEKFCTNGPDDDGSTVWYPQDPDSDLNIWSQISDPAMRKYFRDEMLKMSDDVNRPYNDAKYTQNHERKKKEDEENKRRKEEQDLKDAAAKEQEKLREEAANMMSLMHARFADVDGDSKAAFETGTRILVWLSKTLTPSRSQDAVEFVECELEVKPNGQFTLHIIDSTFGTHKTVSQNKMEFPTVESWRSWKSKESNVMKFSGAMNADEFVNLINSANNHHGVFARGINPWGTGRITKNPGSPAILKETDLDNGMSNEVVTQIWYLPDIEWRVDKKEKWILLDVERHDGYVSVSMSDNSRSKSNMSYAEFAAFVSNHGHRPYTAAEVERSKSPVLEVDKNTEVGMRSKMTSIWSWIAAFNKAKQFYTDDYFKRRQDIDGARALQALTWLIPEWAGLWLWELKAKSQSDLDGVMRAQIQRFKDSLWGKWADDGGGTHGAVIAGLIEKQVFLNYSNSLEFKHKAAGYLLHMFEDGGPYARGLASYDGRGYWVKALFGEAKQKEFLAEQKRRYEMMKASGNVEDRDHENLVRWEMRFIQTLASSSKWWWEKIRWANFHRAVEWYADKISEAWEMDNIAQSQMSKGTPEEIYTTTFKWWAIGNNNPKLVLWSLKAMIDLTESPTDYGYVYKAIIITIASGMTAFKFDKTAKDKFKWLCRKAGIPIWLMIWDINHPEQVMWLLDYCSSPEKGLSTILWEKIWGSWNPSMLTPETFRKEVSYDGDKMHFGKAMAKAVDERWGFDNKYAWPAVIDALNFKKPPNGGTNRLIKYASDPNIDPKTRWHIHAYIKNGMFNWYAERSEGSDFEGDSPFITESMLNMNPWVFNSRLIQWLNASTPDHRVTDAWEKFSEKWEVFDDYLGTVPSDEKQELLKIVMQRFFALLSRSNVNSNIDVIKEKLMKEQYTGERAPQTLRWDADKRSYWQVIIDSLWSRNTNYNSNNTYIPHDDEILNSSAVWAIEAFTKMFKNHFHGLWDSAKADILNFNY